MSKKKYSLSFIISGSLITFLFIISLGIFILGYFNTQNVFEYNVREYFKQTSNLTNMILEEEKKHLNEIAFEIAEIIKRKNSIKYLEKRIGNITSVDQIDILFLKNSNNKIIDFSNTLFETKNIINTIVNMNLNLDNSLIAIDIKNEKYVLLLSSKKIIDEKSGRVEATLFAAKIFNDNFSLVNNLKQKASLEDIYIYFSNELISTTSTKELLDMSMFKNSNIVKHGKMIYFKNNIKSINSKEVNMVFITLNSTFELINEQFIKAGVLLLAFLFITFIVLYLFSNKFIIKPFSNLLRFAQNAKDNKNEKYTESKVLEFDNFALDLKLVIDELRDIKEKYSQAIDGVQDGLWDIDLLNNNYFLSKRYYEMLGYTKNDEIVDKEKFWKDSIYKKDYRKTLKKLVNHLKGKTTLYEDEYRFKCKDGSYKWIKVRGKAFFDENNKPINIIGFHTDIDDIIRLQKDNERKEQMIYQQSKLAAMGEMIANIAHQWRQPLNVISTIASVQVMRIHLDTLQKDDALKDLNKVIDTVQYLSTIIERFRNFFSPNKELEEFFIKEIIDESLDLFKSSYSSDDINININLQDIQIVGYKFELMQVLINIINNSRDALLSKVKEDEDKFIFIESYTKDEEVVIKIYDNAGGIKDSIREKIYDPYFTTKHQSQGTGLGLYMSNEIIKKHFKGELTNKAIIYTYNEKEYKGEEFKIKLPLV